MCVIQTIRNCVTAVKNNSYRKYFSKGNSNNNSRKHIYKYNNSNNNFYFYFLNSKGNSNNHINKNKKMKYKSYRKNFIKGNSNNIAGRVQLKMLQNQTLIATLKTCFCLFVLFAL